MPDFSYEDICLAEIGKHKLVIGIDEVGRGPWAGPVVAGAAAIDRSKACPDMIAALNDSKKLSAKRREILYAQLSTDPGIIWATGEASVEEIDSLNILQATYLAMRRAVQTLSENYKMVPDFALVDGNKIPPDLPCPAKFIIKGDGLSASISAASILAKVTRDRIMLGLHQQHPDYGWCRNAGYGTKEHQEGLNKNGLTKHHRKSFSPIRKLLTQNIS